MNRHLGSLGGFVKQQTNSKGKWKRAANEWSCVEQRDRWPVGEPKSPASHPRVRWEDEGRAEGEVEGE